LKGKLAIKLFKSYPQLKKKPYWGNHFWSRGYFVNTIGLNLSEDMLNIRRRRIRRKKPIDKTSTCLNKYQRAIEGFALTFLQNPPSWKVVV
jgi:Transposase IS200 like